MANFILRLDAFLSDIWAYYFGNARRLHGVFVNGFWGYHEARNCGRGLR